MSIAPRYPGPDTATYAGLRMTAKQFFKIPDDGIDYELLDGVVIVSPSAQPIHNHVAGVVYRLLGNFLDKDPIGMAFIETDVHVGRGLTGGDIVYRAEINYWRKERMPASLKRHFAGPPDLMVEVISDSSRRYDTETKFADYERLRVREYWLFDPQRSVMRFYRLRGIRYVLVKPGKKHFGSQAVPGFKLDLERVRRAFRGL